MSKKRLNELGQIAYDYRQRFFKEREEFFNEIFEEVYDHCKQMAQCGHVECRINLVDYLHDEYEDLRPFHSKIVNKLIVRLNKRDIGAFRETGSEGERLLIDWKTQYDAVRREEG